MKITSEVGEVFLLPGHLTIVVVLVVIHDAVADLGGVEGSPEVVLCGHSLPTCGIGDGVLPTRLLSVTVKVGES